MSASEIITLEKNILVSPFRSVSGKRREVFLTESARLIQASQQKGDTNLLERVLMYEGIAGKAALTAYFTQYMDLRQSRVMLSDIEKELLAGTIPIFLGVEFFPKSLDQYRSLERILVEVNLERRLYIEGKGAELPALVKAQLSENKEVRLASGETMDSRQREVLVPITPDPQKIAKITLGVVNREPIFPSGVPIYVNPPASDIWIN